MELKLTAEVAALLILVFGVGVFVGALIERRMTAKGF